MGRACIICHVPLPVPTVRMCRYRTLCGLRECRNARSRQTRALRSCGGPTAEAEAAMPAVRAPRTANEEEVARWSIALSDAEVLGLVHLVPERARRLAQARERLEDVR